MKRKLNTESSGGGRQWIQSRRINYVDCELKKLRISPYIISILKIKYQRVVIDGVKTEYSPRGVPQGTVLRPILFSIMIHDIRQGSNVIVKFSDDINLRIKVTDDHDNSYMETNNIINWAETYRMKLNYIITQWEMSYAAK